MRQQGFLNTNDPGNLPSPLFQPRPGWGGQLARWFKENAYVFVFRSVLLVAVVLVVASLIRGDSEAPLTGGPVDSNLPFPLEKPITLEAQPGEGVTHMAARAVDLFVITQSDAGTPLDGPEHLFAVDTLSREAGWRALELGEKIWFPVDIIAQIVREARDLTASQYHAWARVLLR